MRVDSYDFGRTRAQDGSIINQDGRDGQIYSLHGRVDYAFSPVLGWFAGVEGNQRNIRGTPQQTLDSQGYRALSGFTIGFTKLLTGEFGAGYVQQRFDDPSIGSIEGPSYRAMLTWSPTRLIDVRFKAEQIVTQTPTPVRPAVLANAFQLGVDYELRRNVIASLSGGYENDRFFGQQRRDKVITSDARVKYLMNRYSAISVFHRYTERNSDIPAFVSTNIRSESMLQRSSDYDLQALDEPAGASPGRWQPPTVDLREMARHFAPALEDGCSSTRDAGRSCADPSDGGQHSLYCNVHCSGRSTSS